MDNVKTASAEEAAPPKSGHWFDLFVSPMDDETVYDLTIFRGCPTEQEGEAFDGIPGGAELVYDRIDGRGRKNYVFSHRR